MNVKEKINKLYNQLETTNNLRLKSELCYYIIQLKNIYKKYINYNKTLYQDTKLFINNYISSLETRDAGYDVVNITKIIKAISFVDKDKDKYRLSEFAFRLLKINSYEKESKVIKNFSNSLKTKLLKKEPYKLGKYCKLLLHLTTYNIWTIIFALIIIFFISFIVLLPAPTKSLAIFDITYDKYSDIFLVNHLINLTTNFFGVENEFKITTNSIIGIVFIILIKTFYIVVIVNYLHDKVLEILKTK